MTPTAQDPRDHDAACTRRGAPRRGGRSASRSRRERSSWRATISGRSRHRLTALGDGLALTADTDGAGAAYAEAVDLLERQSHWRQAATAALAWARMLGTAGREPEALDVLDRAAALGMRAAPESAPVEH